MLEKSTAEVGKDHAFYGDMGRFDDYKRTKEDPDTIKKVAKEFEALFIQMALKSMREAEKVLQSGLTKELSNDIYQEMHDQQLALHLSKADGFGLAKTIIQQMTPQTGTRPIGDKPKKTFSMDSVPTAVERSRLKIDKKEHTDQSGQSRQSKAVSSTEKTQKTNFDLPQDFVREIYPHAEKAAKVLGVDPRVLISQAALETGWGKKLMNHGNGDSSFNLFGIKANIGWKGDKVSSRTTEYENGVLQRKTEQFRAYNSFSESMNDYVEFIRSNQRYQDALKSADNPRAYTKALQDAGYATDPHYANKIMRVFNSDQMAMGMKNLKDFG